MVKLANFRDYPLSPELTGRVLSYLNAFRLFISVSLMLAAGAGIVEQAEPLQGSGFAAAVLLVYFAFSVYFILASRGPDARHQALAQQSLLLDVLMITLLLHTFDGIAVLLVFTGAAAGIVLPLRLALGVAGLAAVGILTQPALASVSGDGVSAREVLSGVLYGLTLTVITIMTHLLANWARDYRLIAEQQMVTLARLQQINELVIRRLRSGVLAVDRDGEIKLMNESAWFLLGSPPAGERCLANIAPGLNRTLKDWLHNPTMEPKTLHIDGSQAEVVPKFISLPEGHEIDVIMFLEDNDVVSQRALEMSSLSLAQLSTSIAHEIRNPLSAISHAAQLLREDQALEKSQRRLVDIIGNHSRRMNEIIENILQLSRREKSNHELIRLDEWIVDLLEEFNAAHPGPDFRLAASDSAGEAWVLFDRSQLHQVLWKLMENALQHLGEDHPAPRLELRLRVDRDTGFSVLSVEDNGAGISGDRIARVFEPFFTTRKAGSGLGLYIARQLCEANGSEITVDSVPDERTRFHIRMPLASGGSASVVQLDSLRETV